MSTSGDSLPNAFMLGGAPVVRNKSEPSFSIIILSKLLKPIIVFLLLSLFYSVNLGVGLLESALGVPAYITGRIVYFCSNIQYQREQGHAHQNAVVGLTENGEAGMLVEIIV